MRHLKLFETYGDYQKWVYVVNVGSDNIPTHAFNKLVIFSAPEEESRVSFVNSLYDSDPDYIELVNNQLDYTGAIDDEFIEGVLKEDYRRNRNAILYGSLWGKYPFDEKSHPDFKNKSIVYDYPGFTDDAIEQGINDIKSTLFPIIGRRGIKEILSLMKVK